MLMKKKKILSLLLLFLFIGIVKDSDEFGSSYRLFLKKPWHFRIVYINPWSEQDWSELARNPEAVKNLKTYCQAILLPDKLDRRDCSHIND